MRKRVRPRRHVRFELRLSPLARLWILRMLMPLGAHRRFLQHGFDDEAVATALGLGTWVDGGDTGFDAAAIRAELRRTHAAAEADAARGAIRRPATLTKDLGRLAKMLELSDVDRAVLEFAVVLHNDPLLDAIADLLGPMNTNQTVRTLAVLLDRPHRDIGEALGMHGVLARSGLLKVDRSGATGLRGKLDLLSDSFADRVLSTPAEPMALLRGTIANAPGPELALDDYAHVRETLAILQPYLRHALATGRRGVNVYLHGPPGTGKTQLARLLAGELRAPLFEVASENEGGEPIAGVQRLRAFQAAQTLLANRRALLLFDEVEDVFADGEQPFGRRSTAQARKGWMNRVLEDGAVPTFWLSNSLRGVDPAFLRRFDIVLELPVPPRRQRLRIAERACGDLVAPGSLTRIAAADALSPAMLVRAASVVRAVAGQIPSTTTDAAMRLLVGQSLDAVGARFPDDDAVMAPGRYDLAFLNADTDLPALARGLETTPSARLCLYGPPGTGKTAFGRWLADRLGVPLHVKRASDLLSPMLGETEQQLARAFRDARDDGALLMIDEVDGFLRDRQGARYSWEVTQVNEMLTQMEAFPGRFIASTNLMDGLDPAALRRFDAKIRFDFLRPAQGIALLRARCEELGLPAPSAGDERALARLDALTPGDFAAVVRHHRFRPVVDAADLVGRLGAERVLKDQGKRRIGFVR